MEMKNDLKKSMQGISRVIPYFMSGFSLFALISLVLTGLFPLSIGIKQYWPVLLGASLYLPIVLFVSNRKIGPILASWVERQFYL